ncbi:ketopantoate hydroxymethyltransferase-domain-containing protein [Morchella snyderi]|nr:ketopantoate hydroxymethyltransferase-domain-containing protein [Morchella snyderi]
MSYNAAVALARLALARPAAPISGASSLLRSSTRCYSSHSPMAPGSLPPRKKITINSLRTMHANKVPIAMMTAHDFPSGLAADQAHMDMILVGDSLAMVALGMEDTNQLKLEDMLHHCRAVSRAVKSAFTVGDLPMGSYEVSPEQAVRSSISMIQYGRVESVKLEGGAEMAPTVSRITSIGIPVLGHIGLTPQRSHALGGFRVQGKTASSANNLLTDALALQAAGCYSLVLEAVPAPVAALISSKLRIPTIGIGAGGGCGGQVLVQIDALGNFPEGRFMPKFVRKYGSVFEESKRAIERYRDEVKSGEYPAVEHTYPISKGELEEFEAILEKRSKEFEVEE